MWNGRFFDNTTLTAAGLIVQLGHDVSNTCQKPSSLRDLMVFDLSGVHRLVVRYCECDVTLPNHTQLLLADWFPAMIDRPATAFADDLLDFFHTLQDQNKCNPYDFYNAILQRTDAAGLGPKIARLLSRSHCLGLLINSSESIQRDDTRPTPVDSSQSPQAGWCITPFRKSRFIARRGVGNLVSCVSSARGEHHRFS